MSTTVNTPPEGFIPVPPGAPVQPGDFVVTRYASPRSPQVYVSGVITSAQNWPTNFRGSPISMSRPIEDDEKWEILSAYRLPPVIPTGLNAVIRDVSGKAYVLGPTGWPPEADLEEILLYGGEVVFEGVPEETA